VFQLLGIQVRFRPKPRHPGFNDEESSMHKSHSGSVSRTIRIATLAMAAGLFALGPIAHAQSDAPQDTAVQAGNPPADANGAMVPVRARIRILRLSDVEGNVQILRDDKTQFPQAVMNMPLVQGSQINTGANGRAEIEFEDGSVSRITPNSSLKITNLESTADGGLDTTVEQLSGLIYYELRSDPQTPFHVVFNGRSASPLVNSTFRINLNATPQDLAVIDGKLQVQGPSESYSAEVPQGKTIQFAGTANAQYTIANWIAPNGFDDWNQQRDQEAAQQAQNQTPARVQQGGGSIMDGGVGFGWSDLDNAGGWYPLPGYGTVWQPYGVGADFDPYGNGSWGDFGGGYSFISGYPWGWLPYNCGAWSYIGSFGWGWSPGLYGCGGFGFGIGWGYGYGGYGHRWRNGRYPHTNIYGAPAGYHAPVPPSVAAGHTPQRLVQIGNPAGLRTANLHAGRPVNFNGEKIAPLHSMMSGVTVPTRNAALYNNYPAHAFHGDVRGTLMSHTSSTTAGIDRGNTFNAAHSATFANHSLGNRAALGQHAAFGSHTSFGSHGSFGGTHSAFAGSNYHTGSTGRSGGFSRGGVAHASGGGGGFHGGGGSMGHSGGMSSGGGHSGH
jgi:hypothetical protein